MSKRIMAVIVDDDTILLDGRKLSGKDEVASALQSALQIDPDFILVICSRPTGHYKGIGTVIYASQRVGVPVDNLRFTTEDGDVVTIAGLRALHSAL